MEKLREELYRTIEKINDGYVMNDYEMASFVAACDFLLDVVGWDYEIIYTLFKMKPSSASIDAVFDKAANFSKAIIPEFSEILLNMDVEVDSFKKEYVSNRFDMTVDILKFFKHFDRKHYKLIRDLVFDFDRYKVIPNINSPFRGISTQAACSAHYNGKDYVYVTTGKDNDEEPIDSYKIATHAFSVHELGHIIDFTYMDSHKIYCSVFGETTPYTAEFSYLGVNKNKVESSKEYFSELDKMVRPLEEFNEKGSELSRKKDFLYVVGYSVGLYLSHLYMTNIIKFRYYYNLLKKNIYVDDEKLISIFLNDEEFLKMDYLKKDIVKNKKILLKA